MIKIIIQHPVTRLGLRIETCVEDDEMVETVKRLFRLLETPKGPQELLEEEESQFIL